MSQKKYVSLNGLLDFLNKLKELFATKAELNTKATANHGIYYGTCDTAANTQIKTVTLKDPTGFSLEEGTVVIVKFKYSNSMPSPQMKVGTTEPILMRAYGSMPMSASQDTNGWTVGAVQIFVYDGTNWVRDYWRNTKYVNEMLGHGYGICETEETTLTKVVTCSGLSVAEGGFLSVKFTNAVPANSIFTLNNNDTERIIYYNGEPIVDGIIRAGETATFVCDGTDYHLVAVNRDSYSKADHEWVQIYDSGEITEKVNAFANIDISGYKKLRVAVKCVNDGTNSPSKHGGVTFTATNGTKYQFNIWSTLFTNAAYTSGAMATFEINDGWLICPNATRILKSSNFLGTEGGVADNLNNTGSGIMRCTNPLSTMMVHNTDNDANYYFLIGSRVMVWGCKV